MSGLYDESKVYVTLRSRVGAYFEIRKGTETGVCNVPVAFQYFFD